MSECVGFNSVYGYNSVCFSLCVVFEIDLDQGSYLDNSVRVQGNRFYAASDVVQCYIEYQYQSSVHRRRT